MKNKPLRALLIKRLKDNKLDVQDTIFIETLDNLYKLLDCTNIEIQERVINGKIYDFIFDGEFLINGKSQEPKNAVALGIDVDGSIQEKNKILEVIFGNLLICGQADEAGQETSLQDEDLTKISKSFVTAETKGSETLEFLKYTF